MSALVKRVVSSTADWHPLDREGVAIAIIGEVARWFDEMHGTRSAGRGAGRLAALWLRAEIAKHEDGPNLYVPGPQRTDKS